MKAQGPAERVLAVALADMADDGVKVPCAEDLATDAWFAETPAERAEAVAQCDGCVVFDLCTAAAAEIRPRFGVWAGRDTTPRPRRGRGSQPVDSASFGHGIVEEGK